MVTNKEELKVGIESESFEMNRDVEKIYLPNARKRFQATVRQLLKRHY